MCGARGQYGALGNSLGARGNNLRLSDVSFVNMGLYCYSSRFSVRKQIKVKWTS